MTFPTAYLSGLGVGAQTLTFHFVAILSANAMGAPNTATLVIGVGGHHACLGNPSFVPVTQL